MSTYDERLERMDFQKSRGSLAKSILNDYCIQHGLDMPTCSWRDFEGFTNPDAWLRARGYPATPEEAETLRVLREKKAEVASMREKAHLAQLAEDQRQWFHANTDDIKAWLHDVAKGRYVSAWDLEGMLEKYIEWRKEEDAEKQSIISDDA